MDANRFLLRMAGTVTLAFVVALPTASADDARPVYIEITETEPDTFRVGLRVPPVVPAFNQPTIALPDACLSHDDAAVSESEMSAASRGMSFEHYRCQHGLAGQEIEIRYPLAQPAVTTIIRVTLSNGAAHTAVLGPGENRWKIPQAETRWGVARDYLWLGVHHIWVGTDHLLFIVCLIFIAGSFRRILATITGFTLAHSITLALSALQVIRLPVPPIEAAIALSVVYLAVEIAKGPRDNLTWRYPISVSSLFGLLHGLGFAAVLNDIGLPKTELVTGLLFFNIGVEIGQVLFAVVAIAILAALTRLTRRHENETEIDPRLQRVLSYTVGVLATVWLFERVSGFG